MSSCRLLAFLLFAVWILDSVFLGFHFCGSLFSAGTENILLSRDARNAPVMCVSRSLIVAMRVSSVSRAALNSLALFGARQGRLRLQGSAVQLAFLNSIGGEPDDSRALRELSFDLT